MNTLHSTRTGPAYGVSNAAHDEITARHRALENPLAGLTPTEAAKLLTQTGATSMTSVAWIANSCSNRTSQDPAGTGDLRVDRGALWTLLRLARECVPAHVRRRQSDIQPRAAIVRWRSYLSGTQSNGEPLGQPA
ncbi:MAG: hypothetical protein IPP88_15540 [Betaproteobacteria bacterium]|nr:hypothetical protein [Betaproteobacteria bacterium]